MKPRFEMWILLKTIAIGELIMGSLMFYLMYAEIQEFARPVPIGIYAIVGLALLFFARKSIREAHKCYAEFYKPRVD